MNTFINGTPLFVLHYDNFDRLKSQGKFEELIQLQKSYAKHSNNERDVLILADAYGYAGDHKNQLKTLKKLHHYNPYDSEVTNAVADCLDQMGKIPEKFNWLRPVTIFRGGDETIDWCIKHLQKEKCSDSFFNLYIEMWVDGCIRIEEEDVLALLEADERFHLEAYDCDDGPMVRLRSGTVIM